MLTYYILDGTVYEAPQICSVFEARVDWAVYDIMKVFSVAASRLETVRQVDVKNQHEPSETTPQCYTRFHITPLSVSISNEKKKIFLS